MRSESARRKNRFRWPSVALLIGASLGFSGLAGGAGPVTRPRPLLPERPNVLLVVADDLNVLVGCYGADLIRTPQLDRFASTGVLFENAYCNSPICNASRTSFLSGRYPESTGVLTNKSDPRASLAEATFCSYATSCRS